MQEMNNNMNPVEVEKPNFFMPAGDAGMFALG